MFYVTLLFAISFLALIGVSALIVRHEMGGRLALSPIIVCIIIEANIVWPAACYAYYTGVSRDLYAYFVFLSCTASLVGVYLLSNSLGDKRRGSANAFLRKQMIVPQGLAAHFLTIVLCASLLSIVGFYYYGGLPSVIHLMASAVSNGLDSGSAGMAGAARLAATKGHYFGGEYRGQGAILVLMSAGWPFLTSLAILGYVDSRQTKWLWLSVAMLTLSFIFVAGSGSRGPFLWLLISVFVVLSFRVRLNLRKCVLVGCLLFAVLFGLSLVKKFSAITENENLLLDGAAELAERIYLGNGSNSILIVELVRDDVLQLQYGGVHATKLSNALPFIPDELPLAYELFVVTTPDAGNRTTFATMTTIGEVYADFGWFGSVVVFALFGLAVAILSRYIFGLEKTLVNTTIAGTLSLKSGLLTMNSPIGLLAWLVVFFAFVAFYKFALSLFSRQLDGRSSGTNSPRGRSPRHPRHALNTTQG